MIGQWMMISRGFVKLHFSQLEVKGNYCYCRIRTFMVLLYSLGGHLWIHTGLIVIFNQPRMNRHNNMMSPKGSLYMTWKKRNSLAQVWDSYPLSQIICPGVLIVAQWLANPTRNHGVAGSILVFLSGLRIWPCHELWWGSQMQLRSGILMAVA